MSFPFRNLMAMLPGPPSADTGEQTGDVGTVQDVGTGGVPLPGAQGPALGGEGVLQAYARRFGGVTIPSRIPGMPKIPSPHPGRAPRIPAAVAAPIKGTGGGEGGGLTLDTIMPFLILAAPFLEMSRPGYGVGLVQGVLGHQAHQQEMRQKTIFGLAQEFSKSAPEHMDILEAALNNAGIAKDITNAPLREKGCYLITEGIAGIRVPPMIVSLSPPRESDRSDTRKKAEAPDSRCQSRF
jgi:hypothetical protein